VGNGTPTPRVSVRAPSGGAKTPTPQGGRKGGSPTVVKHETARRYSRRVARQVVNHCPRMCAVGDYKRAERGALTLTNEARHGEGEREGVNTPSRTDIEIVN